MFSTFSKFNLTLPSTETKVIDSISQKHITKLPSHIWSKEEDMLLIKLSQSKLRNKWKKISKIIGTKTASQCTYRLKVLSDTKIDIDSPDTSQQLSLKIELDENEKAKANDKPRQMFTTNAEKKNRNVIVKINNVAKLFGLAKKANAAQNVNNNQNQSSNNVSVANKIDDINNSGNIYINRDSVHSVQRNCGNSNVEMKDFNCDNPFTSNPTITRKESPPILLDSNSLNLSDNKRQENEENFKKEYLKYFTNENKNLECLDKDINDIILLDFQNLNKKYNSPVKTKVINGMKNTEELEKLSIAIEINKLVFNRLQEIEQIISSDEFKNSSQTIRMANLSSFLVEINIFLKKITSKQEEQLCMEIQSKILSKMIEQTQNQLITNNGEELLS